VPVQGNLGSYSLSILYAVSIRIDVVIERHKLFILVRSSIARAGWCGAFVVREDVLNLAVAKQILITGALVDGGYRLVGVGHVCVGLGQ
jgi:hypothetical protein